MSMLALLSAFSPGLSFLLLRPSFATYESMMQAGQRNRGPGNRAHNLAQDRESTCSREGALVYLPSRRTFHPIRPWLTRGRDTRWAGNNHSYIAIYDVQDAFESP
jgi:hypothetical protein